MKAFSLCVFKATKPNRVKSKLISLNRNNSFLEDKINKKLQHILPEYIPQTYVCVCDRRTHARDAIVQYYLSMVGHFRF